MIINNCHSVSTEKISLTSFGVTVLGNDTLLEVILKSHVRICGILKFKSTKVRKEKRT